MIEQSDLANLKAMRQTVTAYSVEGLNWMAEQLILIRDRLKFDDVDWYHNITQHAATLDSASTFHPANDTEKNQLDTAVQLAINQIINLIDSKIN